MDAAGHVALLGGESTHDDTSEVWRNLLFGLPDDELRALGARRDVLGDGPPEA